MTESDLTGQETIGEQLIEDISKIQCKALGEGAVACQGCSSLLSEGSAVSAYVFRPVCEPTYQLGYVKCTKGRPVPAEYFTLGVRELIVRGRVGTCADQATQSSWPVLLAPEILAVSTAGSRSLRWLSKKDRPSDTAVTSTQPTTDDPDRGGWNEPPSLVDRVIQARVAETCATLRACDAPCGGGR
jgi:hypothetical protein